MKPIAAIKQIQDPVVLSGHSAVLADDPFGLYNRLNDAQLSAVPK